MPAALRPAALALLLFAVFSARAARAELVTRTVEYRQGDAVLEGFLAYDTQGPAKKPGVLVVHEWTGIGPYVKRRAEQLARLGYVAFAADIYGKGIRPAPGKEAAALAGKYKGDRALLRARARAGLDELLKQPNVIPLKVAAIGYCFGGTTVLELARSGAQVAGTVSFHGQLDTPAPADARNIKGKVLVLTGGDDPNVPPPQVKAFEDEMRAAAIDWQLTAYGGAVHSFTNPEAGNDNSKGVAYNATADRRSWAAMRAFFDELFK